MQAFPVRFSISDLENFSGVKAHTIRIWERRYQLLSPERSRTNIRDYGMEDLKALLNVAYLNGQGLKISKIAALTRGQRDERVREISLTSAGTTGSINSLKIAMLTYDADLFERVSETFRAREGFRGLVERLYIPLLRIVGLLWQSNALCPAQEHFVSNLIRAKIISAIDQVTTPTIPGGTVQVLYLPENEIHELGILYIHFLLRTAGDRVIYLGQSVPQEDLVSVSRQIAGEMRFISILTTQPPANDLQAYAADLRSSIPDARVSFVLCGSRVALASQLPSIPGVVFEPELEAFVSRM